MKLKNKDLKYTPIFLPPDEQFIKVVLRAMKKNTNLNYPDQREKFIYFLEILYKATIESFKK